MKKIIVFIKREWQIELSYRTAFVFKYFSLLLSTLIYFYIGKIIKVHSINMDYILFVIPAIAFFSLLKNVMSAAAQALREEQIKGSIEFLLSRVSSPFLFMLYAACARATVFVIEFLIYIILVPIIYGYHIVFFRLIISIPFVILSLLLFFALGFFNFAYVLLFKRGNPILYFISIFILIFGGVYYPVKVLPPVLGNIAHFFGIAQIIATFRNIIVSGTAPSHTLYLNIAIWTVILFAIGYIVLKKAFAVSLKHGKIFYS